MKSAELRAWLERIEGTLAALDDRIRRLEDAHTASGAATKPAPPLPLRLPPPPTGDPAADLVEDHEIDPDVLLIISAAVAAMLGETAQIRQVRLLSSRAWAQEGRVSIQASHRLH
jgi:methylmalonyl-CoA carboxyltransferase large subunit